MKIHAAEWISDTFLGSFFAGIIEPAKVLHCENLTPEYIETLKKVMTSIELKTSWKLLNNTFSPSECSDYILQVIDLYNQCIIISKKLPELKEQKRARDKKLKKLYNMLEKTSSYVSCEKVQDEFRFEDTLIQYLKFNDRLKSAISNRKKFQTPLDSFHKMTSSERQEEPVNIRANFIRGLSKLNEISFQAKGMNQNVRYGLIVAFANALFDNLPNLIDKDTVADIIKNLNT